MAMTKAPAGSNGIKPPVVFLRAAVYKYGRLIVIYERSFNGRNWFNCFISDQYPGLPFRPDDKGWVGHFHYKNHDYANGFWPQPLADGHIRVFEFHNMHSSWTPKTAQIVVTRRLVKKIKFCCSIAKQLNKVQGITEKDYIHVELGDIDAGF